MELVYKVVEVAKSGDRLVATADNFAVARAAFDTALATWPGVLIELRQKARVIPDNRFSWGLLTIAASGIIPRCYQLERCRR